jgi:hypothetical protein
MCDVFPIFDAAGKHIGFAWQCGHKLPNGELEDPDQRFARLMEDEYERDCAERERSLRGLDDPNRIDTRRARRELGDRQMINLGMRVNRVSARARRL